MNKVNDYQFGGDHYKGGDFQHWDWIELNQLGYLEGCVTKYVVRWRKKNGAQDLDKALHYLEKLHEVATYNGRRNNAMVYGLDGRTHDLPNIQSEELKVLLAVLEWRSPDDLFEIRSLIIELQERVGDADRT